MANIPEGTPPPSNDKQGQQPTPLPPAQQSPGATPDKEIDFSFYHRLKRPVEICSAILLVAGVALGVRLWVEKEIEINIERKLGDVSTLRKIAAQSRPILVFNGNESIVADDGAVQFIKELKITDKTSMGTETNLPRHIHIEFTKFIAFAPILTPVSQNLCAISCKRGKGLCWEFELGWGGVTEGLDPSNPLFRLEILP